MSERGCAAVACSACKGFKQNPNWRVICGYCCGTGRTPIPMEEVFKDLRTRWLPEDMLE